MLLFDMKNLQFSKLKWFYFIVFILSLSACASPIKSPDATKTTILAHRASSGLWIQNSRNAVENTVSAFQTGDLRGRFDGLEVDIVLTRDGVPVLAHDPWVHKSLCVKTNGSTVGHTLIKDIDFTDLVNDYRCGGVIDPEFPAAKTKLESILGFDEFLDIIKPVPDLVIYLDVKIQTGLTALPRAYAEAIFSRWQAAGMVNRLYVEGPDAESITAYKQYAQQAFTAVLSYPPFYAGEDWVKVGIKTAVRTLARSSRPLKKAQAAAADAVASPVEVMTQKAQNKLQKRQKQTIIYTPNSRDDIQAVCRSGADVLITDYPGLGPCD